MAKNQLVDDTDCIAQWQKCMKEFNVFVGGDKLPSKAIITEWKEKWIHNVLFTFRQRSAIAARCENVSNGSYGNTKTELQMNNGKS